jgi:retron-type reverse transcriptase
VIAAFDSVWHDGLLYKLKQSGIPHYLLYMLKSFLTEQTFQVRIGSTLSEKKKISAGVPQGAILSPTLYNIYCHDLSSPTDAYLSTYADDTMISTL